MVNNSLAMQLKDQQVFLFFDLYVHYSVLIHKMSHIAFFDNQ